MILIRLLGSGLLERREKEKERKCGQKEGDIER